MYERYGKRVLDIISASIGLVVMSPLILVVALLVKHFLGSPVIFKQMRPGKNEKIFEMYKFRSMADKRDQSGELLPDSERLTGFGKIMRSTSLDELPELLNVLRGDMSLVGPRPLLVEYLPLYNELQKHRHDVRPGLTGLAQINGRNCISWEEKFEYDLEYIKEIGLLKDLKIICITIIKVLKRKGISSANTVTMERFSGTRNLKSSIVDKKEEEIV